MEKENELNQNPENINVEMEIEIIRQQIAVMGANDYEFDELDNIKKLWQKKEISGKEAVARARAVLNNKQDYH